MDQLEAAQRVAALRKQAQQFAADSERNSIPWRRFMVMVRGLDQLLSDILTAVGPTPDDAPFEADKCDDPPY
jgi:hypothetical protein